MLDQMVSSIKNSVLAYRSITPLSQLLIRGFSATVTGLACIIIPDVLAAFGVAVAQWKHVAFFIFGCLFVGTGLAFGFLPQIFPVQKAYELLKENGFFEKYPDNDADERGKKAER